MDAFRRDAGPTYREKLVDIVRRARNLEHRARHEWKHLDVTDPNHVHWMRIERRYATIRGNAEHLLLVHSRKRQLRRPLTRIMRCLNLL